MGYVASQRGTALIVVCTIFDFLAIAAVALRLWSRRIKKVRLMVNDYAMIVGLISILHLYIVIFEKPLFTKLCYAAMVFSSAFCLSIILETLLICTPPSVYWKPYIRHTCGNSHAAYLATHIINLLTDLVVIILPMPLLWGLQMKASKKIAVSVMFGLGGM
ncbi:MAG: hypothetical protein Q9207_003865 [Kuettlingeria erythrocarpa]